MSFFQSPRQHYILTFQPRTLEAKAIATSAEAKFPTTAAPAADALAIGAKAAVAAGAADNPTSVDARPAHPGSQPAPPTVPSAAAVRPSQ